MVEIFVSGRRLELPVDGAIRLVLNSPLFADEQPGSMTYAFPVNINPANSEAFGWTHLPGSRSNRRKDFPAVLIWGVYRLEGILQVRKATQESYQCNLIIPPGNVPAKVWKRKLKQFDFGTVSYKTGHVPVKHYAATVPNLGGMQFGVSVWIKKGSQELFRVDYQGVSNSGNGDYIPIPFWPDVAAQFNARVDSIPEPDTDFFNDPWKRAITGTNPIGAVYGLIRLLNPPGDKGPDLTGYRAFAGETSFTLLVPDEGNYSIEYTVRFPEGRSRNRVNKIPLVQLERKIFAQSTDIGINDNIMETDTRYCLPMMRNDSWYDPEKNKQWNGYVNDFQIIGSVHIYTQNTDQASARYSLSPAVYLQYAMTRACQVLGYRVTDRVFKEDLAKLFLWVNRSLDEQMPGTDAPYNQNMTTWKIGNYLPDMSLTDFISKGLKNIFARVIFYPSQKQAVFVLLEDVLSAAAAVDWSDKLVRGYEIEAEDYAPQQLTYSVDSGDENAKQSDALFSPKPTDDVVDADQDNDWKKYDMPFSPISMEHKTVQVNTNDPDSPYYSRALLQTKEISTTPVLKQRGISPLFEQSDVALSAGRIMFFVPSRTIPNPAAPPRGGDDYPARKVPTADYETETLSLQLGSEKSVLAKLGRKWIDLISRPTTEKCSIMLNSIGLQQFRWENQVHIRGLNYLVEEIDITIRVDGKLSPASVTLRKV